MMWTEDSDYEDYEAARGPSKSQLKRESQSLQELGEALLALSEVQLARLELPPELLEAVRIAQSITAHGGLRRQRKFIGKLLRQIDAEPIREGLAALKHQDAESVRLQHRCEDWRDRMLAEGDGAVDGFLAEHPQADRRKLRQLVRDGRKEREAAGPPRAARLLFRYLREVLSATAPDQDEEGGGE